MATVKTTASGRKIQAWKTVKDPRAECELCAVKKPLCAAHIVPRHLLDQIEGLSTEWYDEKFGINVRRLCYNHHRLFDTRKLDLKEHLVMWAHAMAAVNLFNQAIAQNLKAGITIPDTFFTEYDKYIKHSALYDR